LSTLQELLAQKAELERKIQETQRNERQAAIDKVRALMAEFGLSVEDLGSKSAASGGRKKTTGGDGTRKAAVKYRDAAGNTWSGRGLQPRWLKEALAGGKSLQDFAV
jgi:DNA-binding protein H-NS